MRPAPTRQQGFILLPVVLAITLIAVIAFMLNEEGAGGGHRVSGTLEADQLQHLTEAGMAHALWQTGQAGCGPFSDLPSQPFADGSYAATVTPNNAGGQISSYPVAVSDDAMIKNNSPTQNYGNVAQLETYADLFLTDVRRALYRFDIANAGIPAGTSVVSAVVRLFVIDANDIADVSVHRITADWSEATVNWDNINTSHDASAVANVYRGTPAGQYIDINITALVQGWINGGIANQGIMLKSTINFSDLAQFSSKEYGNAAQRPQLIVNVIDGSLSNRADISATGTLTGGATRAMLRKDVVLWQTPPQNASLQPDSTQGVDAEIWDQKPDNNYGNANVAWVSTASNDKTHTLLLFDTNTLPVHAKIESATLSLSLKSGSGPNQPVSVHRLEHAWKEESVTWNSRETGLPWDTPGTDFDPTPVATTTLGPAGQRYDWDVTALVQGWADGRYANNGMVLLGATSGMPGEEFYTSDDSNASRRPSLSITYSCECGIVCQAPAGSGKLLLVVGDATSIDPDDLKKQALFESWGYTVSLIDDSDDQTAIDAALANNDAAYISQTVSSWVLSNKLNAATIGVLNEEGDLSDNLGTSSNHANSTGRNLTILDNSHDITALFPLGSLPIYSADMDGLSAAGTLAPGLQALGEWGGSPGLAVVETGGILADGSSSAPGRRVTLPLGRDSPANFNWDYLNNNGRLIVQRAIEWASSSPGLAGPIAHWKLDEISGLTAVDSVGGHDGTLSNGPSWTTGQLGGGLDFDGIDDTINAGSDATIDDVFAGGATLSAWIRPRGWGEGDFGRIADKADALGTNRNGWAFELYGAKRALLFQYGFSGGIGNWYTPVDSISLDTWQHVAVVYDNSADTNDPVVYIDGVAQTLIELDTPSGTPSSDAAVNFTIGNYALATSRTFDGVLDDVRVYDRALDAAEIAALAAGGGGGGGSSSPGDIIFKEYTQARLASNGTSMNISKPGGTATGDLLIAVLVTDGEQKKAMSASGGWSLIDHGVRSKQVSMDVWWKLAAGSEPAQYTFGWAKSQEAYGWIMRFTGHDPGNPINVTANTGGKSAAPTSPSVNATVANAMILRIGGFDDDDITVGNPGLAGHTAITMNRSDSGSGTTSGGAGYLIKAATGASGTSTFALTASEEYRAVTIGIAPAP